LSNIRKREFLDRGTLASFSFSKSAFSINLNGREKRALNRPSLILEKSRLITAELVDFPGKATLGVKISKHMLHFGVAGQYRSNSKRSLVLGRLGGSGQALKIKISHPSLDEIWVCGSQANEIESQLKAFIKAA
jgi:hypothetical protein